LKYIDVLWLHTHSEEPFRLVSELDDQRYEVRKLEFCANGIVAYATEETETQNTRLGTVPAPPLEEINEDPQFRGTSIEGEAFEALWRLHAGRDA